MGDGGGAWAFAPVSAALSLSFSQFPNGDRRVFSLEPYLAPHFFYVWFSFAFARARAEIRDQIPNETHHKRDQLCLFPSLFFLLLVLCTHKNSIGRV